MHRQAMIFDGLLYNDFVFFFLQWSELNRKCFNVVRRAQLFVLYVCECIVGKGIVISQVTNLVVTLTAHCCELLGVKAT